jgi:WD40 repeat protein
VLSYDDKGVCTPLGASSSAVTGLAGAGKSKSVWIIGLDDTLRRVSGGKLDSIALATTGQPRSVASSSSGHVLVATTAGVDVFTGEPPNKSHRPFNESITAVACSEDGKHFAVGREDSKVLLCSLDASAGQLKEEAKLESGRSTITALAFSPDSKYLAAGESNGKINVYDVQEGKIKFSQWVFHTARINAIQFSPEGTQAVSASLDTNVYVWSTTKPMKSIAIKNAFPGGAHGACWLDNDRIASAGADGTVKVVSLDLLPNERLQN